MTKDHERPTFALLTVGCSKNAADSARLNDLLMCDGFDKYEGSGHLDVLIVNSCSFTAQARRETTQALKPGMLPTPRRTVLVGCMASEAPFLPI